MKIALYTKRFTNWSHVPALCSQTLFNSNAIKIPFVINHISRMFFTPLSIIFPCYNSVAIIGFAFSSVTANSFFVVRKQPFGI